MAVDQLNISSGGVDDVVYMNESQDFCHFIAQA